ncbi:MAG: mechanosensitive ion channel family protein [Crocosphaera sp.]|nr:mechanosensitive ion channel family protein [Crocosphaera sp.]
MNYLLFKKVIKLILIFCLTLSLILTWINPSLGQISLFTTPTKNPTTETPPWDLNKAYTCGRFWCSDVHIYDDTANLKKTLLTPELTVAALKKLNQHLEVAQKLEGRAKLIEGVFNNIVLNIIEQETIEENDHIEDNLQFWLPRYFKKLFHLSDIKPYHPWTPKIEIGIRNNHTVIYTPEQFELGIPAQTIVTVTKIDAKANRTTVQQLAQTWQQTIRLSFSNAFWGYEFDQKYFGLRWVISAIILFIILIIIGLIEVVRSLFKKYTNHLRYELQKLTKEMAVYGEAIGSSNNPISVNFNHSSELSDKLTVEQQKIFKKSIKKPTIFFKFVMLPYIIVRKLIRKNKWLYSTLKPSQQKLFLRQQTWIKQKINFTKLLLSILCILQLLIMAFGLTIMTFTFRSTRFFSVYFLGEITTLIILWISLLLVDKLLDFVVDYSLNRWAIEGQVINPESNRYTLRINTYSVILKQGKSFVILILGFYSSIWLIGLNPSVLAGAGILAVAVAFLSRNLLEDMLNGILILWTDRYAIGDVIDVNGMGGLVENINLFVTSLRNLDGQVIAIPNSKISTVINHTKDWSRVNFTIKIAWNENIKKAIEIMRKVAHKMQIEATWSNKFLEPLEVLGVDEVSHEGILIHILIKTKPSEHWSIGREFRLRVKEAFDEENITLGIPHHTVSLINNSDNDAQLLSYIVPKQDN